MTPAQAIAMLDRQLAANGEDVTLQRWGGSPLAVQASCTVRAFVRGYRPNELIAGSGIIQGDTMATISPTQITAAGWPGDYADAVGDAQVPRQGDRLVVAGRTRVVQAAAPIYMNGTLVRVELQARG